MVTKEDVEKAKAAYAAAYAAAWEARYAAKAEGTAAKAEARDKYIKLKEAYENGN